MPDVSMRYKNNRSIIGNASCKDSSNQNHSSVNRSRSKGNSKGNRKNSKLKIKHTGTLLKLCCLARYHKLGSNNRSDLQPQNKGEKPKSIDKSSVKNTSLWIKPRGPSAGQDKQVFYMRDFRTQNRGRRNAQSGKAPKQAGMRTKPNQASNVIRSI